MPLTSAPNESLCPSMPVLDFAHRSFGEIDTSIVGLVGLQHLLGSTVTLVDRIAGRRVDPGNVLLLGKPYSTCPGVLHYLQTERDYWVHPESTRQAEACDNDSVMDSRIRSVLARMRRCLAMADDCEKGRVLLIDDGGRAIRLLHSPEFADLAPRFTCVEQTRCGIRTIAGLDLRMPVVNVAESWVKLDHESPMIAESVITELSKQLAVMKLMGIYAGRRALVIGYGAIGQAVAGDLRRNGYEVRIFEKSPSKRAAAAREGFCVHAELRAALREGGAIIGCTGLPSMGPADYEHIRSGAVLISASSADVEFCAWHLRAAGECLGRPETFGACEPSRRPTSAYHPCFSLYRIGCGAGSFYLVNGGYPVNFTGGVDPIEPRRIQLTRSLLYLGALQASQTRSPGLHDLDEAGQVALWSAFRHSQTRTASTWEWPEGRTQWVSSEVC